MSLDQVKPINMVRSEFVLAMAAKKIDAAVFHADDAYVITHQLKGAKVLSSEYKVFPNWWYGGVSMLDKYGQAHKAVVIRFLTAMMLADRCMNNPANTSALIKLGTKVSGEDEAAVAYAVKFLQTSKTWPDGAGLQPGRGQLHRQRAGQVQGHPQPAELQPDRRSPVRQRGRGTGPRERTDIATVRSAARWWQAQPRWAWPRSAWAAGPG